MIVCNYHMQQTARKGPAIIPIFYQKYFLQKMFMPVPNIIFLQNIYRNLKLYE